MALVQAVESSIGSARQVVTSVSSRDDGRLTSAAGSLRADTADAPTVRESPTAPDTTATSAAASAPPVRRDIVPLAPPVRSSDTRTTNVLSGSGGQLAIVNSEDTGP